MRYPRSAAATILTALTMSVPPSLADPRGAPCDELIQSPTPASSTEIALVEAWLQIGLQDPSFDAEPVRSWLQELRNAPDAEGLAALAFQPPAEVLSASVLEGYEELSRMADALKQSNRFSSHEFQAGIRAALSRHLGEADAATEVRRAATEERKTFRPLYSRIDLGDSIQIPPLVIPPSAALPAGRMVSIIGYGSVVFSDLDGGNRSEASVPGSNFGSLTLLENGNILVLSANREGVVFTPEGRRMSRIGLPDFDQEVVPVPLDGGGYFLAGHEEGNRIMIACPAVISADGKSVRTSRYPRNEFSSQPLKLRNGAIAVTGRMGNLFLFDPEGNLANLSQVKGWISHPPAQLTDGTIVLVTDEGSVRFFHEDGSPKSSWVFFTSKVELGHKPSAGPIPLPDGTVAVQTYRGKLAIMDSSGNILASEDIGETRGSTPQVLSDGSLLVSVHRSDRSGSRDLFVRVVRNGARLQSSDLWETAEMLTSPLVRLKENLFAVGTINGELILFDESLVPYSHLKLDRALRMPTFMLPDGRIAAAGDSGTLHLLDSEAAIEGLPVDFGQ